MDLDVFALIFQASWPVKAVIALMVAASVFSWGAIFSKWREFSAAENDTAGFLASYHQGAFEDWEKAAKDHPQSPLSAVMAAGVNELKRIARYRGKGEEGFDASQLRAVNKAINWAGSQEALRLENRLSFLATVGSATPFVGLFGTVIGIINAFAEIGITGNAGLETVGPGIAEALVATAIGLFAAIPATVAYNAFVARLRDLTAAIDLFTVELQDDIAHLSASAGRAAAGPRAVER
ncbi:MAG: MotA/TolQ/ExbB proton channel family protein [Deltaproteobacteria bacterium]|nr:MotA/TolQ/ExbB proton channel family protein [Deltaproteobacteria bacterium]